MRALARGVGVAIATSGPGATNLVTGIATAMMDSSPIVCITGQVGGASLSVTTLFRRPTSLALLCQSRSITICCVTRAEDLAPAMREAFWLAKSGRAGPGVDRCHQSYARAGKFGEFDWDAAEPGHRNRCLAASSSTPQYGDALELINHAKRPVILAGHGILLSGAMREVCNLRHEHAQAPVAMTLLGIGSFPASHPLNLCLG